jgi:hypothetical protein
VGTNITGTASGLTAGNVTTNANLTGAITSVGNATSLGSFSSANLASALTDETGSGANVFATSPTLVTPILGTPQSGTLTSCTGLPISTGVSGLGTGIATALAVNTGSAGAPVLFNGALGTPTSGTVTNLSGTASININGTVGATTPSTVAATTGLFTGDITRNGAVGVRAIKYQTSGVDRWYAYVNGTAESGSNQGSSYAIGRFNDAGTFVANSLLFDRADGSATFEGKVAGAFNGTIGATTASTGAFTTLSATGNLTLSAANPSLIGGTNAGSVSIQNPDAGAYISVYGSTHATKANKIEIVGTGGVTLTNGLAVTGALSSTGLLSTTAGFQFRAADNTQYELLRYVGGANNPGVFAKVNEAGSYASIYGSGSAGVRELWLGGGVTEGVAKISSTGVAVTGALSATGALAIGNTVATAVAVASTHKVTIVIGGVTYYLLATNV